MTGDGGLDRRSARRGREPAEDRRPRRRRPLAPRADLDAALTLRAQGLTLRSVLSAGREAEVKTATSQNRAEENETVRDLAAAIATEAAAAAGVVGARLAGVDVVTPDRTVPLGEAGGAILEVNTSLASTRTTSSPTRQVRARSGSDSQRPPEVDDDRPPLAHPPGRRRRRADARGGAGARQEAAAEGVTAIAATPHVRADFPTRASRMEAGVSELRQDFVAREIAVEILPGAEVDLARLWEIGGDELARMTLAQTGRYLLVEFPYRGWPSDLAAAIRYLGNAGSTPYSATRSGTRRCRTAWTGSQRPSTRARSSKSPPARWKDGTERRRGRPPGLLQLGLVHVLATDAHGPHIPAAASPQRREPR